MPIKQNLQFRLSRKYKNATKRIRKFRITSWKIRIHIGIYVSRKVTRSETLEFSPNFQSFKKKFPLLEWSLILFPNFHDNRSTIPIFFYDFRCVRHFRNNPGKSSSIFYWILHFHQISMNFRNLYYFLWYFFRETFLGKC